MTQKSEIYKEFKIQVSVSASGVNYLILTNIARCQPRLSASIRSISDERMDWSALEIRSALDRAFDRARRDVDQLVAHGLFARI